MTALSQHSERELYFQASVVLFTLYFLVFKGYKSERLQKFFLNENFLDSIYVTRILNILIIKLTISNYSKLVLISTEMNHNTLVHVLFISHKCQRRKSLNLLKAIFECHSYVLTFNCNQLRLYSIS